MSEELVNIEVDGVPMKARKNAMVIQVTDASGKPIPGLYAIGNNATAARLSGIRVDRVRFDSIAGLEGFADLTLGGDATRTLITFGSDTILLEGLDVALFSAADVVFA